MSQNNQPKSFADFTNLYELSKTLGFELKPVGKTLDNMRYDLRYDKDLQTFLVDQEIEDAYQVLKPIFDAIHEEFITDSLESKTAQEIYFAKYLEDYKDKKELKKTEDNLRNKIGITFEETSEKWKSEKYNKYGWKKGSKIANGSDILSSQSMLDLIADTNNDERIQKALKVFKGFFTYFGGFVQNRKNYYETKKEASTAIATRIIHENLPKFCDNFIQLECIIRKKKSGIVERTERKSEYLNAYQYLKDQGKITQIKDSESGKTIEAYAIEENIFNVSRFPSYLSQKGVEEYNRIIGHYNLLINLYNQTRESEEKHLTKKEKTFKRLPQFKTLFKQIGCGKKKALFFTLTYEKKADAEKARNKGSEAFSVEEILSLAKQAGERYFQGKSANGIISTIPDFLFFLKTRENYEGVYWSKKAMNTISDKYFANYHNLKDRLKDAKVFEKAKKGSEEDVKTPEAIELAGLFEVLDATPDWRDFFFRKSLTEELKNDSTESKKRSKRHEIIMQAKKPSEALFAMMFDDITEHIDNFTNKYSEIKMITDEYFSAKDNEKEEKRKPWKEAIKAWMDHALAINQMLKYFLVKESKIKGTSLDSIISNTLKELLFEAKIDEKTEVNWFKWYDALRNYLTKKSQDEAKENKLKLNFKNSCLAGGWDVNKEDSNCCVILQNLEDKKYLAVLTKTNNTIFQKKWAEGRGKNKTLIDNPIYYLDAGEILKKMEYDFWADVSKMIPKCSTQLKEVIKHFREFDKDFVFPVGYKVTSGEQFTEECRITKKEFELNNKVYKKDDIFSFEMRYNLNNNQEKHYIKSFQKEYWEWLLKQEKQGIELSDKDIFIEWRKFCVKKYTEISALEKKYKDSLVDWINFCKYFLSKYPKTKLFDYVFRNSKEYNSVDEFYLDVDICSYRLKVDTSISKTILDKWVDEGKIYLFEIKNQDSNDGKKDGHKNNLHTFYWNAVFKDALNRPKLNGKAEIFYRKALSKDKIEMIRNKKGEEIIKNFRFSKEKFIFHCPITLNFCLKETKVNNKISNYIASLENIQFLGIDRGEKNLAYYSLVNANGQIIKQETLNLPFVDKDGNPRSVKAEKKTIDKNTGKEKTEIVECKDYNELLEARAGDRVFAKKNWQTIKSIKELKNGYISQVIRKIIDIATNNGKFTFIVLEDLSIGFKRGRQKIDKSVYQKLELALAKKLNFLVNKDAKAGEIGSVTKAIQLTPPVNNFSDLDKKKQFGNMLYIKADYTSQTDPVTGWRKSIYLKTGSENKIKEQIKDAFTDIKFDGKDYVFIYTDKNTSKEWKLYSGKNGQRLTRFFKERDNDKNIWTSKPQDVVMMLNGIFKNVDKAKSIYQQTINENIELQKINERTAWESLRFTITLLQQIRNSGELSEDNDFILSPVRDEDGNHFDSRNARENQPNCGDANGAYNIARKGITVSEHIKRGFTKLYITDVEWDAWLAGKDIWDKWISKNKEYLIAKK